MNATPDTLTSDYADQLQTRGTLVAVADRTILRNEFVVAYEEPLGHSVGEREDRRGYLTVWVRDTGADAPYRRVQMLSGDDEMIRRWFGDMARGDVDTVERFIGKDSIEQP